MQQPHECPYSVLGLPKTTNTHEIKKAYKKLALQHHPDKSGGDETVFKRISQAYQVLTNPQSKPEFERTGFEFKSAHELFKHFFKDSGFGNDFFGGGDPFANDPFFNQHRNSGFGSRMTDPFANDPFFNQHRNSGFMSDPFINPSQHQNFSSTSSTTRFINGQQTTTKTTTTTRNGVTNKTTETFTTQPDGKRVVRRVVEGDGKTRESYYIEGEQ